MEREVLRSLLHDHVALDVAFGDRKVDREPRDLDAIAVADGTDRLRRRCARARSTAWGRAARRHGQRSEGVRVWPLSHRDERDSERDNEPAGERATWGETEDPYALVARLVNGAGGVAVADQMWAAFVIRLESTLPRRAFSVASEITRELRIRKDASEREALRLVAESADRAYARMLGRPFAGRTEREVGAELADLLRDEGHEEVGFTIVGSGPNGA